MEFLNKLNELTSDLTLIDNRFDGLIVSCGICLHVVLLVNSLKLSVLSVVDDHHHHTWVTY